MAIDLPPLIWDADWPAPEDQKSAIEAAVRASIADELCDLKAPEDLICHHVFLGISSLDPPFVFVYGEKGSDAFHCRYDASPPPRWDAGK